MTGRVYIGTSGYQYRHWRGPVYPQKLPQRAWFDYYSHRFDTVEINNTFYRLPEADTFQRWREAAPAGFVYALKVSRYLTHVKYLKAPAQPVRRFLERARLLGDALGPLLIQLPPHWGPNLDRLDGLLACLPSGYRWTLELRHPGWLDDTVFDRLREAGVGLCIHDLLPEHPRIATADWLYLRYHGIDYSHRYSHQYLTAEAERLADRVRDGMDLYAYFNNDAAGHAFHNAAQLRRYLHDRLSWGSR
ncbi:uncharacterized protein FOKN1_2044 [Thiohalobacter thiocyanaticus]|uniref:DUF72 domain-containing protein n=1 Tax=Thiohalobacter thiocyanaticus TaxID=585455 RepID=A0A1Z4VT97_9GAMM|nr:DUF72 domain-containing protein [Thiohalobacter thiocyanaticus]BAZ94424.1 uncharacterized protein FOKN1_2044 [Thiohalobacter thiocyanaticus]